jgi:hypothetical protein
MPCSTWRPRPCYPAQACPLKHSQGGQVPNVDPATGAAIFHHTQHDHSRPEATDERSSASAAASGAAVGAICPRTCGGSAHHPTRPGVCKHGTQLPPYRGLSWMFRLPHPLPLCDCATCPESRLRPTWPRSKARWLYRRFLG